MQVKYASVDVDDGWRAVRRRDGVPAEEEEEQEDV